MSKQRIRRRGADGHDRILDVDLGPGSATTTGPMGASTMGDMQPILTGGGSTLRELAPGGSWRVVRTFVITGRAQRRELKWHGTRRERS